ncbi:hypothetical protein ACFRAU_14700 [Arthrobacter sp. NPDC056691]|uniref:hypothetical protein n=1 Tax=Arthrobacter sp. NPDC056691 TaxID=3345913 RepID=UPI00366EDC0E
MTGEKRKPGFALPAELVRQRIQFLASGAAGNPVAKQSATQEQQDEFFAVLARVGSVSMAAREVGLARSHCVSWARHAGIASIHRGVGKRAEFLRLREAGVGRMEPAATVGASRKSDSRGFRRTKATPSGLFMVRQRQRRT